MTIDRMAVATRAGTIAAATQKASQYARVAEQELAKALNFFDPNLSDTAMAKERAERANRVKTEARDEAVAQRTQLTAAVDYIAQFRPVVSGTDGLLAVQQAWENVRSRLDSGLSYRRVLDGADATEALAVEKFAPDWIAARTPHRSNPLDGGQGAADQLARTRLNVSRDVLNRLAAVSTDPGVSEALSALSTAVQHAAATEPYLRAMENVGGGSYRLLQASTESALALGGNPRNNAESAAA